MKALSIAVTELRRTFRQRTNILFVFVYPMLLILVLGVTFGGLSIPRVGVVSAGSGALGDQLRSQLEKTPSIRFQEVADARSLQTDVARGDLDAGVVIPSGTDAAIRGGHSVVVTYLARPGAATQRLGETVRGVVAKQAAVLGAAQFAVARGAAPGFDSGLDAATRTSPLVPSVSIVLATAGTPAAAGAPGPYDVSAWTELLLFLFLIALTGGAMGLIETRRLGIARRLLATPTAPSTVIAGHVLGRLLVAMVQSLVIIFGSALLFGVRWGDPAGVTAIVLLFSLASAGAGILLGTLFRNEQQAIGVTLLLGLGLAAIGGCMVPLEVFSPTMQRIAHITPHAWANDAFAQLVAYRATAVQIVPQLAVIAAYAAALLALASWRLRQALAR